MDGKRYAKFGVANVDAPERTSESQNRWETMRKVGGGAFSQLFVTRKLTWDSEMDGKQYAKFGFRKSAWRYGSR